MAAFLISRRRVAHRMVALHRDRHPDRVHEAIDGMERTYRIHPAVRLHGEVLYVPDDLPAEVADRWVRDYLVAAS